jgi:hypothetical protein
VKLGKISVFRQYFIFRKPLGRLILLFLAAIIMLPALLLIWSGQGNAAQITIRSLSISSAVPADTGVIYSYSFTLPSNTNVQSMQFQACTTAIGGVAGCTAPAGLNINQGSQQGTNGFTSTTAFSRDATGGGGCAPANNVLCIKRTQATAETGAKTIAWNTQTNPSTANSAFYIRMTTYSDAAWATAVDAGTVASAVVQSLTVAANVAEILQFCIGNTTITDDVTTPGADCSAITGTSVNIGTLDPSQVNISPWSTDGGNSTNGIAMLRTNAANGATVAYRAIPATSGSNHLGTLRLNGAACSASSGIGTGSGGTPPAASGPYTDGCIDAAGTTQNAFTSGIEQFGMTISGVNCRSTTSYTCAYTSGTNNLQQQTNYIGGSNSTTFGATAAKGFAWDESGSTQIIASSTSSSVKQVDDEALILNFAATPSITTPFGSYTVQADFIAVPSY